MNLDARSERSLVGVKPALVRVVRRAAEIVSDANDGLGFIVTEGLRSPIRQAELVKAGASRTMNSRHLIGEAVDLAATVGGEVRWDWNCYLTLATAMKAAAKELGVDVVWGGAWESLASMNTPITAAMLSRSFPDGPHYELSRQQVASAQAGAQSTASRA